MKIILLFTCMLLGLISCSNEPQPINYGKDICSHCEMLITDNKWGAEIVNDKGKLYFFDSIECLVAFLGGKGRNIKVESKWTVNYKSQGELIECEKAFYLKSDDLHSPMGLNVATFKSELDRKEFENSQNAQKLSYSDLSDLVKNAW